MGLEWLKPAAFLGSILFALIGVLTFWICFLVIDKLTPYKLWEEIVEKQNIALALVVFAAVPLRAKDAPDFEQGAEGGSVAEATRR